MSKTGEFTETLIDLIDGSVRNQIGGFSSNNKLVLGGSGGPGGGSGIPWGGVVGQLIQRLVTFDTTEAGTMCILPSSSILDNLNRIRYHQIPATWFEVSPIEPRGLQVHVDSGIWYFEEGSLLNFGGADSPTITLPTLNPRIDTLYVTVSGILGFERGVEHPTPSGIIPTISGVLPLWQVYVPPGAAGIGWPCETLSGYLYEDVRPFLTYPPGSGGGGTPGVSTHNLLDSTVHLDTQTNAPTQGSMVVATSDPLWSELEVGTGHQMLKVNAGGTLPAWESFNWTNLANAIAADMAHDHSNAAEGGEVPLTSLGSYAQGSIPRGGAADWEAHDASTDGAALAGDGTDVVSTLTPTWKGAHTHEAAIIMGNHQSIGQTAGPTITFDDDGDFLEITGCMVSFGHTMPLVMIDINSADPNKNGILLGSGTPPNHLGMIRFTGDDFFGFTPSGWLSLTASGTAGGGGVGNHNLLSIVHPDTVPNAALRGFIVRGDNLDRWERYDASTDGAALVGDGNDIISTLTPTWKGVHTHEANIVLDDGAGDSPHLIFVNQSNDQVALYLEETGNNFVILLPDAAGGSQVEIHDSGDATVFSVDSDGNMLTEGTSIYGSNVFYSGNLMVFDADFDTYIDPSVDDVLDIYIGAALDFSFTANAFNVLAGSAIVMGGNTTIGQAAGPLLTFDDGNNYLEIMGCSVGIGTAAPAGVLHVSLADNVSSIVQTTDDASYARFHVRNDQGAGAYIDFIMYGSAAAGNLLGVTKANRGYLLCGGAQNVGLVIGTYPNDPVVFSQNNLERMRIAPGGVVGIGTPTIPHGGVGYAKFALEGTNANAAGPHIQYTTSTDNYPVFQQLNWGHDHIVMAFDAYFDGADKSSDAGSNFAITKAGDVLKLQYDSGVAQGGAVTWNDGFIMNTTGNVGIGLSPSFRLDVKDNIAGYVSKFFNDGGVTHMGIDVWCGADTNPADRLVNLADGNGTAIGYIVGNAGGGVTYHSASDIRNKEVIGSISPRFALEALNEVFPIRYVGKGLTAKTGRHNIGFSAQDVEKVFPEVVRYDKEVDTYSLDYAGLTPILWAQNQALLERIIELETRYEQDIEEERK